MNQLSLWINKLRGINLRQKGAIFPNPKGLTTTPIFLKMISYVRIYRSIRRFLVQTCMRTWWCAHPLDKVLRVNSISLKLIRQLTIDNHGHGVKSIAALYIYRTQKIIGRRGPPTCKNDLTWMRESQPNNNLSVNMLIYQFSSIYISPYGLQHFIVDRGPSGLLHILYSRIQYEESQKLASSFQANSNLLMMPTEDLPHCQPDA